jgi:hypothetical protein
MSLLDHPDAKALLANAVLTPEQVRGCQDRLAAFLRRYLPRFYRVEQRTTAGLVIRGLLSGLQRKTCEPIAVQAGVHRKPVQFFVGAGKWDDEAVMAELRHHVEAEFGDDRAVLVIDASTFPKTGADSCGVARQWCGRLGKEENCQRGIFLVYAAPGGYAPPDRRLYLPKAWAADGARRARCHVPDEVKFQEGWRIAADLLERCREGLPHAWATGDEFGRPAHFRAWLREEHERYVLDVPSDTVVRDRECRRPRRPAAGAVLPGRRLGGATAGGPLDPADHPGWRAGAAPGRRDDGPGADEARPPQRPGGTAGGDAHCRGRAPHPLRPEQRRARGAAGGPGPGAVHEAQGRGGL